MNEPEIKKYRIKLGFGNKSKLKSFFDSKDIVRNVDYEYLDLLNKRLERIILAINNAVVDEIKPKKINEFIKKNIYDVYEYMKKKNLLIKFQNNKQRQLERSYYDWSRGRIVANFFKKAMAEIFQVSENEIRTIGMDNLDNPETFNKAATADFEITTLGQKTYRIEFQCGFQGINDIKEHKVLEARRVYNLYNIHSLIIHVDLYNGLTAFVDISNIEDENINWETRTQFEGKKVFHIDDKYFKWDLNLKPPVISDLLEEE